MSKPSKITPIIYLLPLLLVTLSIGCSNLAALSGGDDTAAIIPTRTPLPTFTPTPAGQTFVEVATLVPESNLDDAPAPSENTAETVETTDNNQAAEQTEPTATATIVVEPSPTPEPVATDTPNAPMVTVQQEMNVRGGPGTNYPVVGSANSGNNSKALGRNDDGSWLQVEYPSSDGKGWVFTKLVDISGDVSQLPIAQASMDPLPPQPVAQAPQPEQQPAAEAPPPAPQYQFTPAEGWHASPNGGIVQFKGDIKDESGNVVNGYSILVDNWSWKVLSHPTGPSQWYPGLVPGAWDVVMENINGAQGWWWMSVVRYDCDFSSGFDSQCRSYTQLSEEIKIEVHSPEESIINAPWICHWDCDKGLYQRSFVQGKGYVGP